MLLKREELPILIVNLVYIPAFTVVAVRNLNYEFVLYVLVIIVVAAAIVAKQHSVRFDRTLLWGLTLWGLMHMAGGNLRVGEATLYSLQLVPGLLRFDQFVHVFGFGVATLVCHHLLRRHLTTSVSTSLTVAVLVVLMGSGVGAVNEILEFVAVKLVPETGVGGYENTLWDLIFNVFGGLCAVGYLFVRESGSKPAVLNR